MDRADVSFGVNGVKIQLNQPGDEASWRRWEYEEKSLCCWKSSKNVGTTWIKDKEIM